jgi:hypothetical protein
MLVQFFLLLSSALLVGSSSENNNGILEANSFKGVVQIVGLPLFLYVDKPSRLM